MTPQCNYKPSKVANFIHKMLIFLCNIVENLFNTKQQINVTI